MSNMRYTDESITNMTEKELQDAVNGLRGSYKTTDWANKRHPNGETDETRRMKIYQGEIERRGLCEIIKSMCFGSHVKGRLSK